MSSDAVDFNRRAVRPVECFRAGWQLIKEEYWLFFGITFVGMLLGGMVPFGILLGPMWCGIEICLLRRLDGRRATFNHLFEGFNFFGPSVVATLLVIVPTVFVVVMLYLGFVVGIFALVIPQAPQGGGPPGAAFFGSFLGLMGLYMTSLMVVSAVIGMPTIFMYGLIVERQMSGLQAFGTAVKAVFANFGGVLALVLLNTLLSMVGMSLFCFGMYLVLPVTFAAYAMAYRQVFPPQSARVLVDDWSDDDVSEDDAGPDAGSPTTGVRAAPPRDALPDTGFAAPPE